MKNTTQQNENELDAIMNVQLNCDKCNYDAADYENIKAAMTAEENIDYNDLHARRIKWQGIYDRTYYNEEKRMCRQVIEECKDEIIEIFNTVFLRIK